VEACNLTDESTEKSQPRPRIQTLSDLIFGLALSIGALTLVGQSPSDFLHLVLSILYYGFSFMVLIGIWRSYTRIMSLLPFETDRLINLNILLLFLVSVEPYLFNQLLSPGSSLVMVQYVSIVYAFDLGGLFLIQAFFTNSLVRQKKSSFSEQLLLENKYRRNLQLAGGLIFFVSTLPVFWYWRLDLGIFTLPLRFILWFAVLPMRLWVTPKAKKRVS
jgi:uncharacterized membrane protein